MGRNANVKAGVQFEEKKGKKQISDRVFDESSGDDDSDEGDDVFVKNPSKAKKQQDSSDDEEEETEEQKNSRACIEDKEEYKAHDGGRDGVNQGLYHDERDE